MEERDMKTQRKNLVAKVAISLLFCIAIVFWGFQVIGEELTETQKEVWKVVETEWEYFKQGDVEAVLTGGHDDSLTWWSSRAIPLGKSAIRLSYQDWFDLDKPVSYELKPLNIHIFGNVANVFYKSKWKGKKIGGDDRSMETWVKQDNKWKFLGLMGCSCEQPPVCP